jgi:protein TonB
VTFQAPEAEPEPVAPAPVTPEPVKKVVQNDAPRAPRPQQAPKKIEEEVLIEKDEDSFVPQAGGSGDGSGMVAGNQGMNLGGSASTRPPPTEGEKPKVEKPKADKPKKSGPITMPEDAVPPKPVAGNAPPEFPEEARAAGVEGEVYLKIVINEDGSVGDVEVKKGEEPFVSAAVAAVKRWKYTPALVDGKPTAVYRIIKVPFKLKS